MTSHINFYLSLDQDARNWLRNFKISITNPEKLYHNTKVLNQLDNEFFHKLRDHDENTWIEAIQNYLVKTFDVNKLEKSLAALEIKWNNIESNFFDLLSQVTEKPIYTSKFRADLTTLNRCPYSTADHWFMVQALAPTDDQITACAHELLHMQFEHYYQTTCSDLSLEQYWDLKESMTVILNSPPFDEILPSHDKGYAQHQEMRKQIAELWHNRLTFEDFLNDCKDSIKRKTT